MGADKNSSPKRELDLYLKFTTKDFHTSLKDQMATIDGGVNRSR
jgi:hypothetical protein